MSGVARFLRTGLKLLILGVVGALLFILRYMLKTPQSLKSVLPGEERLYKWTHGHIFYKVLGEGDAPPLVLIHAPGIGSSSYEMRDLMEPLGRHYRVYALDLLGFGLSDRPSLAYSADFYVKLLQDFLADLIKQPATLLASGTSCNYSMAVAARTPALCKALILLSPLALFEPRRPRSWLVACAKNPFIALLLYSILTSSSILRNVVITEYGPDDRHVSQEELDYISASAHQLGGQHAALASLAGVLDLDVTNLLGKITQPSLLIWGAKALRDSHMIAGQQNVSPLIQVRSIDGAGMRVQEECPERLVTDILAWRTEHVSEKAAPVAVMKEPEAQKEPLAHPESVEEIAAYCVKCRQKRIMQQATRIVTKNGRAAMEGRCPICTTKLFRFVAS